MMRDSDQPHARAREVKWAMGPIMRLIGRKTHVDLGSVTFVWAEPLAVLQPKGNFHVRLRR